LFLLAHLCCLTIISNLPFYGDRMPHLYDPKLLQGQTAIVTGSGRNLGQGIALAFAAAGANIVLNGSKNMAALEETAHELEKLGVQAMPVIADVSKSDQVNAMVEKTLARFGRVDIAVSNVGLRLHQPLCDITDDDWRRVMETSLHSAFYLARAVLPSMRERRYGRIIHISGRDGFFTMPNRAHGVTAKAGMHSLAKAIAVEFGEFGITANTIAPGLMDTERDLTHYPDFKEMVERRLKSIPLHRQGTSDDIGQTCLFLAHPTSYISGQLIQANGAEYVY